jgi:ATP-dependent DNA helicase RecG
LVPAVLRESLHNLIDKLHLSDGKYLKRAAILLFHPDPEQFVTGAFVKIGFFRTDADLLYHDEIRGDLFTQTQRTLDLLLTKYLKAGISYRGVQRVESYPVPEAALREAVLNAIVHRDYAVGTPIQISVYPHKLMVWNPGQLPGRWTVSSLKAKHPSHPFNPDVANAFFRAGMIEAWGRGIERIFEACRTAQFPSPRLRYEPSGLWLEFRYPKNLAGTTTQETTQERMIALLRSEPSITRRQLAARVGLTPHGVKYHLEKLRSAGSIRHVGPTKAGHWEILK